VSVDEVKKTVRLGNEAAGQGRKTLERALAEAVEAGGLARAAAHDSRDRNVLQMIDTLDSLDREVTIAVRRFTEAVEQADAYVSGF